MRRDRLYRANKWNKNLFWNGGGTNSTNQQAGDYTYSLNNVGNWMSNLNNNGSSGNTGDNRLSGVSVYTGNTGKPTGPTNAQMQNTFGQINSYAAGLNQGANNANGGSSAAQGISGGSGWEQAGSGLASALPSGEMTVGEHYYRRGVYDAADPLYYVAGGRESEVGNTLSDIGISLTQNGGKWGALAGAGFKITGDLWNALGGEKTNKELLAATNDTINKNKNFRSNAQGFDDIVMPIAGNTSALNSDVYEGSLFHSVGSKNDDLRNGLIAALDWSDRSVTNNVDNLRKDQLNRAYANYSAYGGPMERIPFPQPYPMQNNMGALEYNVMSDMLTNKKQQTENKNTMSNTGNVFLNSPNGWYGLGGVVQTHGGDFSSGLVRVNAGKSHEENPYQGVQMGVDSEGTPNLVEEGETVFNDYVYSNRIYADGGTLKKFHLPKKAKLTYAEISKKLEAEIKERPNDPISRAGFKAQMEMLADEQERQKAEMEAARAREAFEALSDEEKVAVMQRAAEEEQMAQQAMAAEAQQQTQQSTPEEVAMAEQGIPAEEVMNESTVPQEQLAANGGKLFGDGGALDWLNRHAPNLKYKEEVARVMEENAKAAGKYDYYKAAHDWRSSYEAITQKVDPTNSNKQNKYYQSLIGMGMSREAAFDMAYPEGELPYPYNSTKYNEQYRKMKEDAYNRYMKSSKKFKAKDGTLFDSRDEALRHNDAMRRARIAEQQAKQKASDAASETTSQKKPITQEQPAQATTQKPVNTQTHNSASNSTSTLKSTSSSGSKGDIVAHKYDGYRSGSDGITDAPWGFTVDENGRIDKETGYTDDYRNLVDTLGAKDIKDWAVEHQMDPSLQSFLKNNYKGNLEDFIDDTTFTDDMWRKGATDGIYGFMHHVANAIGNDKAISAAMDASAQSAADYVNSITAEADHVPQVYHALEGDDDYIQGELDPNVAGDESRRVTLGNGDVVIYHKRKNSEGKSQNTVTAGTAGEDDIIIKPNHRNENWRYAGLLGPAVGLGMMAAGVGKPDYGELNAAVDSAGNVHLANYQPIGNYLTYRPMDIWYQQNALNAQSRATDRAIANSVSPSKMAGLIANGYNSQLASGNLYRQALEYNDAQRKSVEDFNRGTNIFNAQAYNQNQQFNANALNHSGQFKSQLAMQAAAQKLNADAGWYNSLYGNVGGMFKGLADLGRENYQYNQMVDLLGSGAMPVSKKRLVESGLYSQVTAEGGKLKRKKHNRNLTI